MCEVLLFSVLQGLYRHFNETWYLYCRSTCTASNLALNPRIFYRLLELVPGTRVQLLLDPSIASRTCILRIIELVVLQTCTSGDVLYCRCTALYMMVLGVVYRTAGVLYYPELYCFCPRGQIFSLSCSILGNPEDYAFLHLHEFELAR